VTPGPVPAATTDSGNDSGASVDEATQSVPTEVPERTLADEDITEVVELDAGQQIEDAQGNLISVYGFAMWPDSYSDLPATTRSAYPFVVDLDSFAPTSRLVALDIGLCTAGINAEGFGTVEFLLSGDPADPLFTSTNQSQPSQLIVTRHPVVSPGFSFPPIGECARGWLPLAWDSDDDPATARYVLSNRSSSGADVEQHLYQWPVAEIEIESGEGQFSPGETVTFNDGQLADTTVTVDGWAELLGQASELEGTRPVGVSLSFCPASERLPTFGLGTDEWNLIAPSDADGGFSGELIPVDPSGDCVQGWLIFAVPHGAVPTSFFASDFRDPVTGYAEWDLDNAALAPPQ